MARYVESLDGLRALAVLLVLFFHAGFGFAEGGFIGVDVFFVISGFLITGIIARDLAGGEWSFGRFYLRRAARLLPALFATLLAAFAAAYFILTPEDLLRLGRSGVHAALSVSNVFFWLEAGYFDQAAATKPLLHTWSLGVEEQFYLLWPTFMVLLFRMGGRKTLIAGLAIAGVLSLAASVYVSRAYPEAVFFLMLFRIHQFALGGLIALTLTLRAGTAQTIAGGLAVIALGAIAFFASGTEGSYHLNALAPAAAAGAFIWSAEARWIKAAFAAPPMRWIGKRSYSIYLVHWPLMTLWPMATDYELNGAERAAAIAASVLLGALLYRWVETPMRLKSAATTARLRRRTLAGAAAMLTACLVAGGLFWGMNGFPGRVPAEIRKAADTERLRHSRGAMINRMNCSMIIKRPLPAERVETCSNAPPNARRAVFLIGDSFGGDTAAALRIAKPDVFIGELTAPGCVTNLQGADTDEKRPWCREYRKTMLGQAVAEPDFDAIIFAANWRGTQNEDINQLIKWANSHGKHAIVVGSRIKFRERVPVIVQKAISKENAEALAQKHILPFSWRQAAVMRKALVGDYTFVDMERLQCPNGFCPIFTEAGELIYQDQSHYSGFGIEWMAERIKAEYPELLSQP